MAVCLLELSARDQEKKAEAAKMMESVPGLRQKIAGKSIPLEVRAFHSKISCQTIFTHFHLQQKKYVARKARKFEMQGNRLVLPGLELAYLFHGIAHSPRSVIVEKMLPEINAVLADLDKYKDKSEKEKQSSYGGGKGGYWDDYCLAMFLMGVCMRYVAYPVRVFFSFRQVGVVYVLKYKTGS